MWEVWVYPTFEYEEGTGAFAGRYATVAEADVAAENHPYGPVRIVRVDYPATEHTAAEVIAYLEENWNYYEHRELVEDVRRHFNGR